MSDEKIDAPTTETKSTPTPAVAKRRGRPPGMISAWRKAKLARNTEWFRVVYESGSFMAAPGVHLTVHDYLGKGEPLIVDVGTERLVPMKETN